MLKECGECRVERPVSDFEWTHDRYGIPWRKVCGNCYEKVTAEIRGYVFDPDAAGEHLEPEDY